MKLSHSSPLAALTVRERDAALAQLAGWQLSTDGDSIQRRFEFQDFVAAFSFMTRVALIAQCMNHHPQWSNTYSVVAIRLTTHDVDGLSRLDICMAHEINSFYVPIRESALNLQN